jgi:medium-chain acyl-[acyl-carrier-protein] hydrolase
VIHRAVLDLTKRSDPTCHLVSFPFAGAGPRTFRAWATAAPPWIGVWAAQLAGREGRIAQTPINDLHAQVAELVAAIQPLCERPVVFYGHSLGATLAAHVAQDLFKRAYVPHALIVGARASPWSERPTWWDRINFSTATDQQVIQAYRDLGGLDSEIIRDGELMEILVPVFRADAELAQCQQYLREGGLSCPVHALYGREDAMVGARAAGGWRRFTSGEFRLREINGNHLFLKDHQTLLQDVIIPIALSTVRSGRHPGQQGCEK